MRVDAMIKKELCFELSDIKAMRIRCKQCEKKIDSAIELPIDKIVECSRLACHFCGRVFRESLQQNELTAMAAAMYLVMQSKEYSLELTIPVED